MKNNFFKFFVIIIFNLQFFPSYSVELQLDNVQKKIDDIKSMNEVVLGPSESQMFQVLQDITNKLNKKSRYVVISEV